VSGPGQPLLPDLAPYISADRVHFFAADADKSAVLARLTELTAAHPAVTDAAAFTAAIIEREEVSSTGIGGGIAVPHAKLPSIDDFVISIGVSPAGVEFAAKDGGPVYLAVMIAASDAELPRYLQVLAAVASRLKDPAVVEAARRAGGAGMILDLLG